MSGARGDATDEEAGQAAGGTDGIARGRRLTRAADAPGQSLGQALLDALERLTWRTWLGDLRLKGRHPNKLVALPADALPGDGVRGALLAAGTLSGFGAEIAAARIDFGDAALRRDLFDYLHGFAWLRDLAAAEDAATAAASAQTLAARWLARHGARVGGEAWRADLCGRRILALSAHADMLLHAPDLVLRSGVLNAIARTARHLDRAADKAPVGPARIAAWTGVITAGLVLPDGEARRALGEAGLARALVAAGTGDGGLTARSPAMLADAIVLLAQLRAAYVAVGREPPPVVTEALSAAGPALLAAQMGDGALGSWQGALPIATDTVRAVLAAAGIAARPLRQSRHWGYQRMAAARTVVVIDAAPPPEAPVADGGCASTLAFELSDGADRLIVNCGGAGAAAVRLGAATALRLRTTAAHSTLTLADRNSTALRADGTLGHGVAAVELARQESDLGSRVEASHDGYARRLGFVHRRQLTLTGDGGELRGEDSLVPAGRRGKAAAAAFAIRFHLGPGVAASLTGDRRTALLRSPGGRIWQLRVSGHALAVDESVWFDADARPVATQQLVIAGETLPGGTSIAWTLTRAPPASRRVEADAPRG